MGEIPARAGTAKTKKSVSKYRFLWVVDACGTCKGLPESAVLFGKCATQYGPQDGRKFGACFPCSQRSLGCSLSRKRARDVSEIPVLVRVTSDLDVVRLPAGPTSEDESGPAVKASGSQNKIQDKESAVRVSYEEVVADVASKNKIQDKELGSNVEVMVVKKCEVKNKIQDRESTMSSAGATEKEFVALLDMGQDKMVGPKGVEMASKKVDAQNKIQGNAIPDRRVGPPVKNKIQDKTGKAVRRGILLRAVPGAKAAGLSKNKIQDKGARKVVEVLSDEDEEEVEGVREDWDAAVAQEKVRHRQKMESFVQRFGSAVKPPTLLVSPPPVAPALDRLDRGRLSSYLDRMHAKGVLNRGRILREMVRETREKRKIAEQAYLDAQANYLALHGQLSLLEEVWAFWRDEKEENDAREDEDYVDPGGGGEFGGDEGKSGSEGVKD